MDRPFEDMVVNGERERASVEKRTRLIGRIALLVDARNRLLRDRLVAGSALAKRVIERASAALDGGRKTSELYEECSLASLHLPRFFLDSDIAVSRVGDSPSNLAVPGCPMP